MSPAILVVDDERAIGIAIQRLLRGRGYEVDTALSAHEALEHLGRRPYHLVITDLNLHGTTGLDLLRAVKGRSPETAVVMITAYGSEKVAVEAMKAGAADYVPKPFDNDELELVVDRVLEGVSLRRDLRILREQVAASHGFERLVGKSAAMRAVCDVIRKVADTDLTVLIRGQSGTGKELVANAIHYRSPRRDRPLVKVNCAAFSRELVESELFGHEKGAFTGATATREGKFEIADGGTILLDEIGDMALETQAKILRVLQEKELERVGGNRTVKVDVRVLAATNQDLEARVREGTFRQDLYYRLNVVSVTLPALRDRSEDLPPLIEHFLAEAATGLKRPATRLASEAYRALLAHDWPGNVRELEHAIEHAVALASAGEIRVDDLPEALRGGDGGREPADPPAGSFKDAKQQVIERFERRFITEALARHQGNVSRAAEDMGMYRQHLQLKLAEYGIDADSFRTRRGER
jgi:two-component system, NtrC family, response regulator AtoC